MAYETYDLYSTKYTTSQGETWDTISQAFYNTPYRIKELVACNPQYSDVLVFDDGAQLAVPILSEDVATSLPPWKRGTP